MHVEYGTPPSIDSEVPVALTIGNFDGVHRGHAALISALIAKAKAHGAETAVLTFEPHPRCVLQPDQCPPSLTTLDEKRQRLEALGIDRLLVLNFTKELSRLSAEQFCHQLVQGLLLRQLVIGHDFALGHNRQGNLAFLSEYGQRHNFNVSEVAALIESETPVSSSRIRAAVVQGDMEMAAAMLGNPYFVDAKVEHGEKMGGKLGYPTANLSITANKCIPQQGIYTTWTKIEQQWHRSATSIGYRPTFGGDHLTVESFVLDFDGNLYGKEVRTAFIHRLRDEIAFSSVDALIAQIDRDVEQTRALLTPATLPGML